MSAWPNLPVKADQQAVEVLQLATPAISTFNRGTGNREIGLLVFETGILSILEFYGTEWTSNQIRELAEMMHSEFYWLHLAELRHFTLLAKRGDFNRKIWVKDGSGKENEETGVKDGTGDLVEWDGKIYGKITPAVLMKWMDRYADSSLKQRARMFGESQQKALPAAQVQVSPEDSQRAKEAVEAFVREVSAKQREQLKQSLKDADAQWQKDKAKRAAWMSDQEKQTRAYALAYGIDYDKVKAAHFAERIAGGERLTSPEDLQFYENNKQLIEEELKRRASQSK